MAETLYAVVVNTKITNIVVCNDPAFAAKQGWIGPITPSATIQIGSTTPDNGATWVAPVITIDPLLVNQAAITNRLLTNLATLETYIAANPTGSILTANQTLILAKMLDGLTRLSLGLLNSIGGS